MSSPGRHLAPPDAGGGRLRAGLLGALAVSFVVRVGLATQMRTLASLPDEIGFLGDAWLLGRGRPAPPMQFSPPYKVGYPVLVAPLARFIGDPDHLQLAALVLNAVVLVALVPLLMRLVGRLEGRPGRGLLLVAVAASCLPSVWIAGVIAWPDAVAIVVIVGALLALWALASPGPIWRRVWFGPAMAWLWVSHDRFLPALALAALVLVLRIALPTSRSARADRRVAVLNLVGLAGVAVAGWALNRWVLDVRWETVYSGTITGVRFGDAGAVVREVLGQVWYLLCSTYGLAGIGAFALGETAVRAARRGRALWNEPLPLVAGFTVLLLASIEVAAAIQLRLATNFDLVANGRYQDVAVPVVTAVGLARLLQWGQERRSTHALVVVGGVGVVLGALLGIVSRSVTAIANTNLMAGIGWYALRVPSAPVLGPTVALLLGLGALALLVRERPQAVAVAVALVFAAVGLHETGHTIELTRTIPATESFADQVRALDLDGSPVEYTTEAGLYPSFQVGWRLAGLTVVHGPPAGSSAALVVTGASGPKDPRGARLALVSADGILQAWARPGPLRDRLEAAHQLYPAMPAPVPAADARATITVDRTQLRARAGHAVVHVTVRNAGQATIWPAPRLPGRSAVSLVAEAPGAGLLRIDLPEVRPGRSVQLTVDLGGLDSKGPTTAVRLSISQPGTRFTPAGAWPTVSVRSG